MRESATVHWMEVEMEAYFRSDQRSNGEIKPKPNAEYQFADEKSHSGCGCDLTDDSTRTNSDTSNQCPSSANAISYPTAKKATKELSDGANGIESRLPACRKYRLALEHVAKIATKRWNRYHGTVDLGIETPAQISYLLPRRRMFTYQPTADIA